MKAKKLFGIILITSLCVIALVLPFTMISAVEEQLSGTTADGFAYEQTGENEMEITGYSGTDTEITIPNAIEGISVVSVGIEAFKGNTAITKVTFPNNIREIKQSAFQDCTSLGAINLPDSVKALGKWAFNGCSSVDSVDLGEGIELISEGSLEELTALESIYIPASVKEIGVWAFANNTALKKVNMEASRVEKIGYRAFLNCKLIKDIRLPDTLKDLGYEAFGGCEALGIIDIIGHGIEAVGENAFNGITPRYCHPLCGLNCTCSSSAHGSVVFTEWTNSTAMPTASGNYVLLNDVTIPDTWKNWTADITICLNGHTLRTNGGRVIEVSADSTLTIVDCQKESGEISGGSIGDDGGGIYNEGTLNLWNGKIKGNTISVSDLSETADGGGVYNLNIFNMYGGEISNNSTYSRGGGVSNQGIFNMYGGKISNNQAQKRGGGVSNSMDVYEAVSIFNMYGGEISSNSVINGGGGVYSTSEFNMHGGSICRNFSENSGAGIFVELVGKLIITGGEIYNNNTAASGGGIFSGVDAEISNAKIYSNSASEYGGGIQHAKKGTLTFKENVKVYDNTAELGGGGVCTYGEVNLTAGEITRNKVNSGVGGGFYSYVESGASQISFGNSMKISDNTAGEEQSNIYIEKNVNVTADTAGTSHESKYFAFEDGHNKKITLTGGSGLGLYADIEGEHLRQLDSTTVQFHTISKCYNATETTLVNAGQNGAPNEYYVTCSCTDKLDETFFAYVHPLCGGECSHEPSHEDVQFFAWSGSSALPSEQGSYMLSGDVSMNSNWSVSGNVVLCLGGHTIDMGSSYIDIPAGASLTVCDCQGNGNITSTATTAGTVKISGGIFTLENGSILNTAAAGEETNAIFNEGGTVTVKGGNINSANDYGIWNDAKNGAGGTVVATGGQIYGNRGVYNRRSSIEISGAAQVVGAERGLTNYGTLVMTGGSISGTDLGVWNGVFDSSASGNATVLGGTVTAEKGIYNNEQCMLTVGGNAHIYGTKAYGIYSLSILSVGGNAYVSGETYAISLYQSTLCLFEAPDISGVTADIIYDDIYNEPYGALYATNEDGSVGYSGVELSIEVYDYNLENGNVIIHDVNENNKNSFKLIGDRASLVLDTGADFNDLAAHIHAYEAKYSQAEQQHYFECSCGLNGGNEDGHIYSAQTGSCPCGEWGYKLWIGDVYVTEANKNDILGEEDKGATFSYDPDTNTLTLNGANFSGVAQDTAGRYNNIYASGSLNIAIHGKNYLSAVDPMGADYAFAIAVDNDLNITFDRDSTIFIDAQGGGIWADGDIVISEGNITIDSKNNGIYSNGKITFNRNGLEVKASQIAIYAQTIVEVNGVECRNELNSEYYGIYAELVIINNGTMNIKSDGYGIYAGAVQANGGSVRSAGKKGAIKIVYSPEASSFNEISLTGSAEFDAAPNFCTNAVVWDTEGNIERYCALVGNKLAKAVIMCKHDFNTPYQSNINTHWRICHDCGVITPYEKHTPNIPAATEEAAKICTICRHEIEAKLHTHLYDREQTEEKYKLSDASCSSRAVYYKSCSCGLAGSETFEAGELSPDKHMKNTFVYTANADGATHSARYECCNKIVNANEAHSYGDDGKCVCTAVKPNKPEDLPLSTNTADGTENSAGNGGCGGCGSSLGIGAVALTICISTLAILPYKKKKDK